MSSKLKIKKTGPAYKNQTNAMPPLAPGSFASSGSIQPYWEAITRNTHAPTMFASKAANEKADFGVVVFTSCSLPNVLHDQRAQRVGSMIWFGL